MAKKEKPNICEEHLFKSLYEEHSKSLHDFLYYKFGQEVSAGDKVQDAFVALWNNCKQVTQQKAKSYLFTVANNLALNDMKHKKVVHKFQLIKPRSKTEINPEFLLEEKQYLERYQKALALLGEEQRVAFLLNKVEGKSHQEIADLLGVTKKVVEYRIYTALKQLKLNLDDFSI